MKLVSVVIPTYERVHFLEKTLRSVLAQNYSPIEVIVVDDGSPTNETEALCEKYKQVRYYKIKNSGGPATPRNFGFSKSNGEYIAFLDDDDVWFPDKIEKQVAILDSNLDFGLVHGPCELIDEKDKTLETVIGRHKNIYLKHGDVRNKMAGKWTLMNSSVLVRRALFLKVGGFNVNMPAAGEDLEFWTRCSFKTKFYYLDEILVQYRKHTNNISKNNPSYIYLPLYLSQVLKKALKENDIDKKSYKKLVENILLRQVGFVKSNFKMTLRHCFKIDFFWFFRSKVVKQIISKLVMNR